ncbi:MAG: pantoate--beta-alanine ligase, partial [Phycisphaerales bacterium]|nr:pantoate--beta-alanine ligase [Phycisphaerales bacterium]
MGALHEGHLDLVRRGRHRGLPVVLSIFVNPTQFSAHEDFGTYPRTLESDAIAATKAGATAIYTPTAEEIYPDGVEAATTAAADFPVPEVGRVPGLEDGARPHFFGGVCLVVARLFDLVKPSRAIFGEKDWQQFQVIRAMVAEP